MLFKNIFRKIKNRHLTKVRYSQDYDTICDRLKGKYPKDFKWTGWHPMCRCYKIPIMKTEEEFWAWDGNGEAPTDSVNKVNDVPNVFKDWANENQSRIDKAEQRGTLPYFIKDNKDSYIQPLRSSTNKQGFQGDKLGRKAKAAAEAAFSNHTSLHDYSPEQLTNFAEINKSLGVKRGKPMTFEEADHGRANIYKDVNNCAKCVVAHELRLRGYNVTANAGLFEPLSEDTTSIWLTKKGKAPQFTGLFDKDDKDIISKIEAATSSMGSRYHIGWDYTPKYGHIITAERTKDGLILYDAQKNRYWSIDSIIEGMYKGSKLQLLRVDRLILRPELLSELFSAIK